jgi:hypothetical protein
MFHFVLQVLFHTDLVAGKWATPASTQTFISSWTGLKKTYNPMIRRPGLKTHVLKESERNTIL